MPFLSPAIAISILPIHTHIPTYPETELIMSLQNPARAYLYPPQIEMLPPGRVRDLESQAVEETSPSRTRGNWNCLFALIGLSVVVTVVVVAIIFNPSLRGGG
ncbi:hypothetical protein V8E51_006377 [Hyaloscypha variabilis]